MFVTKQKLKMTTQIRSGNTNIDDDNDFINETGTLEKCNFLFVDGEKIGTYCKQPAQWIDGNRKRCDECKDSSWPEATYQCTRILTRGKNKGSPCGSNTKFSDKKCSRCRKIKTTVRRGRVNKKINPISEWGQTQMAQQLENQEKKLWTPPVEDQECTDKYDQIFENATMEQLLEIPLYAKYIIEAQRYGCNANTTLMSSTEAKHFGLPTHHPIEDGLDGRHPCECPKT